MNWRESNSSDEVKDNELCLVITSEDEDALVLSSSGALGWFEQCLMADVEEETYADQTR